QDAGGSGGVAQQDAQAQAEQGGGGQESGAAEDGANGSGVAQGGAQVVPGQDGLPDHERGRGRDQAGGEHRRREHGGLGHQHREPGRDGGERGAQLAGGVLAGDDQDAEDAGD